MRTLYGISPLKEQTRGKERVFLASTLQVLKKFKSFMEKRDITGIFRPEPIFIAESALTFAQRVDPEKYNEIEPGIRREEQRLNDTYKFISLVIKKLDGFVSEADEQEVTKIISGR